ncbi:MAG: DUF1294 domain-containing protein [Anderseniella sp.]
MPGTGCILFERNRLLLATGGSLHDVRMGTLSWLILYITGINLITFAMFAWDKYTAIKGQWRIPEKTLLTLALVGGSPGAIFAQQRLRHKTRKQPFRARLLLIAGLHVVLLVALAIPVCRQFLLEQLQLLLPASWEG